MPIVRIVGWKDGIAPAELPDSVPRLFAEAADLDGDEMAEAAERLMKGKPVDVYFDSGDEAAASAFMTKLASLGLSSAFQDRRRSAFKEPRFRAGSVTLISMIITGIVCTIASQPWIGVLLLVVGVGGLLCSVLIRVINQRAHRRVELLEKFGRNRDAG